MTAMASGRPIEWAQRDRAFHNGTESQEMLPLWQRGRGRMPSRRPAGRGLRKRAVHNGTESRKMLPLRKKTK